MSLPFVWPPAPTGSAKGRLTEIASFRKNNIPESQFQNVLAKVVSQVAQFPISRQNLAGTQLEDPDLFVLVADWTSAEEKDVFEPGEVYQSIKPAFGELVNPENTDFQCHHIILPDAQPTTPETGFYVVYRMRIPVEKHDRVASAFQEYADTLRDEHGYTFIAVAPSREEMEQVVCFVGLRDQQDAERATQNPNHDKVQAQLDQVVIEAVKYGVFLKRLS